MEKAKSRWTTKEIATLVEVLAEVCNTPGASRMQRGGRLNKAIFDRYGTRCKMSGLRLRSPNALYTQRERMNRFAKFVCVFDRRQLALGGRSWFQLSFLERQKLDIPAELRRQTPVFTQEMFNILKHFPPSERSANGLQKKRLSKDKKQQTTATRGVRQGCWTPQDEVQLVCRWGRFMKHKGLTLKGFLEAPYDTSFECAAAKGHSPFICWRKLRKLIDSYSFITAFNDHYCPGWFALADNEQDLRIEWGQLPHDFEDIGLDVFRALEAAVPRPRHDARIVKEESEIVAPPSSKSISLDVSASLEMSTVPIAPLSTQEIKPEEHFSVTSVNALDRLLLEDDDVDVVETDVHQPSKRTTTEHFDGSSLFGACLLFNGRIPNKIDPPGMKEEFVHYQPPLDPEPRSFDQSPVQTLELMLETYKSEVQSGLDHLQEIIDHDASCNQEYLRAVPKADGCGKPNNAVLIQYIALVVKQHTQRLTSILHFAEETCNQSSAEIRSLILQFPRAETDPNHNPSVVMF